MERTLVSQEIKKFRIGEGKYRKEISVQPCGSLYKVVCTGAGGWKVTKVLGKRKAAWFVLSCSKRRHKGQLSLPVTPGRIRAILAEGNMKMSGIEWISIRMVHGIRPIILKAPALFRGRLVYIEPEGDAFNLRIVDPLSDHRTVPVPVTEGDVNAAIRIFGDNQDEQHAEEINQNAR